MAQTRLKWAIFMIYRGNKIWYTKLNDGTLVYKVKTAYGPDKTFLTWAGAMAWITEELDKED